MNDAAQKQTILIVDDEPLNIKILVEILQSNYATKIATSGESALKIAKSDYPPDLILLDIMMPDMDGYEVCKRLNQQDVTCKIPVIFVTAQNEIANEERGFEVGCVDYLTKPVNPSLTLARVKTHTALRQAQKELEEWNSNLKRKVLQNVRMISENSQQLKKFPIESALIASYSSLLEMIDSCHSTHAKNVSMLVSKAAKKMGLDQQSIKDISLAALLHDVGKLGLDNNISNCHQTEMFGKQLEDFQQHPLRSAAILENIESLQHVSQMIRSHHEAFDGTGFPDGLKMDFIPLGAQLIAIADFIDHETDIGDATEDENVSMMLALRAKTAFNPELINYFI